MTLVLYSSFNRNPRGPLDSILAYAVYVRRGSESGIHSHPWYYYLELLLAFRPAKGFFWSEGLIAGLAIVGMFASLGRKALPEPQRYFCRFLTFYTLTLTAFYAAISYKTPWCLLSFFHGMVLLAGVGAWHLLRLAWLPRWAVTAERPSIRAARANAAILGFGWRRPFQSRRYWPPGYCIWAASAIGSTSAWLPTIAIRTSTRTRPATSRTWRERSNGWFRLRPPAAR